MFGYHLCARARLRLGCFQCVASSTWPAFCVYSSQEKRVSKQFACFMTRLYFAEHQIERRAGGHGGSYDLKGAGVCVQYKVFEHN
jgi:hypothetical protein